MPFSWDVLQLPMGFCFVSEWNARFQSHLQKLLKISVREVCLLGFKPHKQACTLKDFMELSIQYFGVLLLLKQKDQQLSRFF